MDSNPNSKYQKAVDRANGKTDNKAGTEIAATNPGALAPTEDVAGLLVDSATALAGIRDKIKEGTWENAPQLLTIPEGKTLVAKLEGNGPPAEFVDEATGEVTNEQTWILSKEGVRVSILGTVQLNKKLPPFLGGIVSITRGRDVRNGTRIYTEYAVAGPRRADGTARDWSTRPLLAAGNTNVPAQSKAPEDLIETKGAQP